MSRPTVGVFIAISLDGCIARDDGALDWLEPMQRAGEDYGYAAFFETIDTVVLGRATHDQVRMFDAWPFAGRDVVVLTHRLLDAMHGERTHAGALAPLLDALGNAGALSVYLDGGQAIRQGLREDLIDTVTLSIVPVVLGSGRRLFEAGLPESDWIVESTRGFASGLVQTRYRRRR